MGCHRKSPREMKRPGKPSAPIPLGRVSASRPPRHNVGSADEGAIGCFANEGEKEEEGTEHTPAQAPAPTCSSHQQQPLCSLHPTGAVPTASEFPWVCDSSSTKHFSRENSPPALSHTYTGNSLGMRRGTEQNPRLRPTPERGDMTASTPARSKGASSRNQPCSSSAALNSKGTRFPPSTQGDII